MYGADEFPLIDVQSLFSMTMTKTFLMWLDSVTDSGLEERAVPAPLVARIESVWTPLDDEKLSQAVAKGAAVTVARVAPSSRKSTRTVPSATDALSATWPDTTAPAERPANAGGAGGVPASAGGGPASAGGVPASAGEPPVEGALRGGGAGSVAVGLLGPPPPPEARAGAQAREGG